MYTENETWHSRDQAILYARFSHRFDLPESYLDSLCTKVWSILICLDSPEVVLRELRKQVEALGLQDSVEVLVDASANTDAHKRNVLLGKSRGYYVSFIDDNVSCISSHYVQIIYQAIRQTGNPDSIVIFDNEKKRDGKKFAKYLNPIKRSIMALSTFPDNEKITDGWYGILHRARLFKTDVRLEDLKLITV